VEQELFTLPELELRNPICNAVCELLFLNTNPSFFSAISWPDQVRPTRLVGFCYQLELNMHNNMRVLEELKEGDRVEFRSGP
jgi:hypothetical protein